MTMRVSAKRSILLRTLCLKDDTKRDCRELLCNSRNDKKGDCFASLAMTQCVAGDCRVATLLAMTRRGIAANCFAILAMTRRGIAANCFAILAMTMRVSAKRSILLRTLCLKDDTKRDCRELLCNSRNDNARFCETLNPSAHFVLEG